MKPAPLPDDENLCSVRKFEWTKTFSRNNVEVMKETMYEISFPKALLFSTGYFALLFPSLMFALNTYMDLADPPVVNPNVDHSFLLSGFGEWLWFGAAFMLPALVLFAVSYLLRWIYRAFENDSRIVG